MFTSNPGAHRVRSSVNYKIRRQGTATEYSVFFNTRSDPDPRWKNLNKLEETIFHECPFIVPSHSKDVLILNGHTKKKYRAGGESERGEREGDSSFFGRLNAAFYIDMQSFFWEQCLSNEYNKVTLKINPCNTHLYDVYTETNIFGTRQQTIHFVGASCI